MAKVGLSRRRSGLFWLHFLWLIGIDGAREGVKCVEIIQAQAQVPTSICYGNEFGMQGSLVQIQSSRPRIKAQNQDVMLGRRHPDFRVLIPWCPNSDHEVAVPDLPTARLWKGKPAPASKVKRIKYGVPGIPYSTPPLNRYRLDLFG